MSLEQGTKAPDFKAPTDGGGHVSLNDFRGKWVVLYFYPKDDTPGCTKEACSFNEHLSELTEKGAEVLGISPDSPSSHDKFKEKYDLNFHLVSDVDKSIADKYEAYGEKKMFGKSSKGIIRSTYLIDPEGVIKHVWPKVKVDGHTQDVLNKLEELKK